MAFQNNDLGFEGGTKSPFISCLLFGNCTKTKENLDAAAEGRVKRILKGADWGSLLTKGYDWEPPRESDRCFFMS